MNNKYDLNKWSYSKIADVCHSVEEKDLFNSYNFLRDEVVSSPVFDKVMTIVGKYSDFFYAPASSRFHLNVPLGLFRHSLGVTFRLLALDSAYNFINNDNLCDIVLAALLHDLGKAGQVQLNSVMEAGNADNNKLSGKPYQVTKVPYYIKKELKTKPGQFEYKRNKAKDSIIRMSIPLGSLHFIATLLSDIWKPSAEVWAAIAYHDGQYVPSGAEVAHAETPLGLALHNADMWQSRVEAKWELGSSWR